MTLSQLQSAQATAGARYAAAYAEFRSAVVDLAALDAAVANSNTGGGLQRSFADVPEEVPLRHPVFAPASSGRRLAEQIAASRDSYVANFTAG